MGSDTEFFSFLQANAAWIFGSGGVVGLIIFLLKIFFSKPDVQQKQIVTGGGKGYQGGRDVKVVKGRQEE